MSTSGKPTQLDHFITLGRSGLRVSPLSLGAGTFGSKWGDGWSLDYDASKAVFGAYAEAGGNFIDTADIYHHGESEEVTARLMSEFGGRDRFVVATKFTMSMDAKNPNRGGNGLRHMMTAVDESLRRLKTDSIDLLYTHWWDTVTPVEEVMRGFDTLVKSGKVRYVGMSNPPAWYFAKANAYAQFHGLTPVIALQMQYNMLVRDIESEYTDAAAEFGTAILPWSPLANGLLSGKYTITAEGEVKGTGRYASSWVTDPSVDVKAARTAATLEALKSVAEAVGATPAQVALYWVQNRPQVGATIIGATKPEQVKSNIAALQLQIPQELIDKLDAASKPAPRYPYFLIHEHNTKAILGDNPVRGWGGR